MAKKGPNFRNCMWHESAILQNNVNIEVTRARRIVQRLITAHEAGVSSEEELQEEPNGPEPLRPVTGVINELSTNPDASGRYVCLAQEPVTP
jgi:hypothetical protein